ncbi:hypothetical protein G6514_008394 [Epicoccum nigrum]|nr:hypothetical protein G6514_008394 [Epicoccum nigrum]
MGLLKEMDPNVPHFTNAVSTPELYTSFSRYVLSKPTRDPHWWRYVNLSFNLRRTNGLPSWVPDLHYQRAPYICQPQSIREFQPSGAIRFKASTSRNTVVMGDRPDEIIFRGTSVESIVLVHPPPPTFHYFYDAAENSPASREEDARSRVTQFADLSEWEKQVARNALVEQPSEKNSDGTISTDRIRVSKDTYWRTLMGGNTYNVKPTYIDFTQDTWTSFLTALHQLATTQDKVYQLFKAGLIDHTDASANKYLTAEEWATLRSSPLQAEATPEAAHLLKLCRLAERQLFNTARGRFGFALRGVQEGDLVVVLEGSPTPHVVRRAGNRDGSERYVFVGDAYVHGLMYGEAEELVIEKRELVFV